MQTWESQRPVRTVCDEQSPDSDVLVLACEGNSPTELVIWKITVQVRSSDYG